jgi:hypothetical protein
MVKSLQKITADWGCQHQKYGHSTIKHAAIAITYKELFSSKHVDLSD